MKKELSLCKMKEYCGSSQKPESFDKFWDEKAKEIESFEPNVIVKKLNEDELTGFEMYQVSFRSFDNAIINAKYLRPKTSEKIPCVLQFHGYPGSSRSYFELSSFVSENMAVLAMDCRGQGGYSEDLRGYKGTTVAGHVIAGIDDNIDNLLYTRIFQDAAIMAKVAIQLDGIDADHLFANGASQGGALAIACAALSKHVKRATILYPFLSDFKRVFELEYDQIAYDGLRYYSRWKDPQGQHMTEMFLKLGYIDVVNMAKRVKCPVLFGVSLKDLICPPSAQFAVYNNLICDKKIMLFKDKGHETIHEFDDAIIPFYNENRAKRLNVLKKISQISNLQGIIKSNRPLVLHFSGLSEVKEHYLLRYNALGFNVICIPSNNVVKKKQLVTEIKEITKKHNIQDIICVCESQSAQMAIDVCSDFDNVKGMIMQSPVFSNKSLLNSAKKLTCSLLLASGQLDIISSLKNNLKFFEMVQSQKKHIIYPRYGHERINDFEDQKMLFIDSLK